MSKAEVDAATRDYIVKPRLEYRTVQGVNGPLVILEAPHLEPSEGGGDALCALSRWRRRRRRRCRRRRRHHHHSHCRRPTASIARRS